MEELKLRDEFIKLGQAMKAAEKMDNYLLSKKNADNPFEF